jgi:hypothetical protein
MVGVSLLSLGSITTTLSIIAGVFIADGVIKLWRMQRPQPIDATLT